MNGIPILVLFTFSSSLIPYSMTVFNSWTPMLSLARNASLLLDANNASHQPFRSDINDVVTFHLTLPESSSMPRRDSWRRIWEWERLVDPHWLQQEPLPYGMHVCIGVVVFLIAAFAVVGNVLVLWSIMRFRSLRTSSNLFIISLAIADIFMSVIDFPLFAVSSFLGYWSFGYNMCQLYTISTGAAGLVNINTLAAISYDRYTVVVRRMLPVHHVSRSMARLVIATIWVSSVLWMMFPMLGWGRFTLEGTGTSCTFDYLDRSAANRAYVTTLTLVNFVAPLMVIVFSYVRIFASVSAVRRGLMDSWPEFSLESQRQGRKLHTELKMAVTTLVIVGVFCVSWTPYVIVAMIALFGDANLVTPLTSAVPCLLAKVATVSNPPLYSLGHPKFRKKIRLLVMSAIHSSANMSTNSPTASLDHPPTTL